MPHRPGHRPNGREGAPNPREGSNGDIQLKQSLHLGAKLYGKVSGSWHDIPLSLNGVTRIGTTYSNHLAISSDKLEFIKGSKSMLSITSTGDINMTGRINLTEGNNNFLVGDGVMGGGESSAYSKDNVYIGYKAGYNSAGDSSYSQNNNVAIGFEALYNADADVRDAHANNNIAMGWKALKNLRDGSSNIAIGASTMGDTDTTTSTMVGDNNIGIGEAVLSRIVGGNRNIAIGYTAGAFIIGNDSGQGDDNILIGTATVPTNLTTGSNNVWIGGKTYSNVDDTLSIAAGDGSPVWITGDSAGKIGIGNTSPDSLLTVGDAATEDTIIHMITNTSDDNIIKFTEETTLAWGIMHNGNGQFQIRDYGDSSIAVHMSSTDTSWTSGSDERIKKNITTLGDSLDIVNKLRPVSYKRKYGKANNLHLGLIAQEVKALIPQGIVTGEEDDFKIVEPTENKPEGYEGAMSICYTSFIPYLIKAIQELSAKVTALENNN